MNLFHFFMFLHVNLEVLSLLLHSINGCFPFACTHCISLLPFKIMYRFLTWRLCSPLFPHSSLSDIAAAGPIYLLSSPQKPSFLDTPMAYALPRLGLCSNVITQYVALYPLGGFFGVDLVVDVDHTSQPSLENAVTHGVRSCFEMNEKSCYKSS